MSELPSGWTLTFLGDICGQPAQQVPNVDEDFIYIDIASIDRDLKVVSEPQQLCGANAPSRARKRVDKGDIIVSMTRPNLNAVALIGEQHSGCIASTGFDVLKPIEVEPRWIFSAVRSARFIDAMCEKVQGALYPAVKSSDIRNYQIPLPPLAEQTRIAAKLDELLAQVDTLKARIDGIHELLKRFRQSILAAAAAGQLTEKWRLSTGSEGNWVTAFFTDFFDIQGGTQPPKSTFVGQPQLGYVQLVQIRDFGDKPVPTFVPESKSLKKFECDDFLIGRYGASVGRICTGLSGAYNVALVKVVVLDPTSVYKPFLKILLCSPSFQSSVTGFERSAQDGFNKGDLSTIEITLPPVIEQTEIVRRVEQLEAFADQLEARVKAAQARIDRLTQSILAKAFRGELVPQDANDEPASVLLERIKAHRAAAPKARRGRQAAKLG